MFGIGLLLGMNLKKTKNKKFNDWLNKGVHNPIQTLVKMHLFGYTVKEVKRYIVRVKNVYHNSNCLNYYNDEGRWVFVDGIETRSHRAMHTKEELVKGGFGDVFTNPMFEVEEVK